MKKATKRVILTIAGNFIGILLAALLLRDFHVDGLGIFVSVLIFSLAQILLAPVISKLTSKYAPSLSSLIALITTFASLLLTSIFTSGLRIDGFLTWITASVFIWLVTVVLGIVLPKVLFTEKKSSKKSKE